MKDQKGATGHIRRSFGREYAESFLSNIPKDVSLRQTAFLIKALRLRKGESVLDAGCGNGRHAIPLAEKGFRVDGIDASPHLISLASQEAEKRKIKVLFKVQDLQDIKCAKKFDGAISIFSLGFLKSDEENIRALEALCSAVRPGGRLLVAVSNPTAVAAEFEAVEGVWVKKKNIAVEGQKGVVTETFDPQSFVHTVHNTLWSKDKSSVRLFTLPEIKNIFKRQGVAITKVYGDLFGKKFSNSEKRMVLVARKF